MMFELLWWIVGMIGVLRLSSGRKFLVFLDMLLLIMKRLGLNRNLMCE